MRVLLALLFLALPAYGQVKQPHMDPLPEDQRAQFGAVGRVNVSGFKTKGACTGTLIAPDVVLTAAHCVAPGFVSARVFVAGWDRGAYIAARKSAGEVRHPAYAMGGQHRPNNDVGLLYLDEPITDIAPLPMGEARGHEVAVVGYHRYIPHLISGRLDCAQVSLQPTLMQIGCPVVNGNSGGPVLQWQDGQWVVVGVISSKRPGGTAIAVPLSGWIREEMDRR